MVAKAFSITIRSTCERRKTVRARRRARSIQRQARRKRNSGRHAAPVLDADGLDEPRGDRCTDDRRRQGRRRQPHHHAARLIPADRLEQAGDRRHADDFWVGESHEQLAEGLGAPQRPGAEIPVGHDGDIDKRDFRRAVVKCNLDLLIGHTQPPSARRRWPQARPRNR